MNFVGEAEGVPSTEIGPVLSLDMVKPGFHKYIEQAERMVRDADAVVVQNDETLKFAVSLGGEAKKIVKLIEAKKKEVTADASAYVKAVGGFCKIFTERLDAVERGLKKKISDYQYKVELERRKQEEAARKAAADLQKKIDAEAKKAGVEAPIVTAPVIPKQESAVRTETGTSAYQVKRWSFEIIDATMVPIEYCSPDEKKIRDAIRMGIREVKGVRIFEEMSTRLRT
jgi:hypothetical protein